MRIGVLGINFKSAEIGVREAVSKACQYRVSKVSEEASRLACVVLSTCNRTEIYFSAENLAEAHSELLGLLREEITIPFEHKLYSFFGHDCFLHLAQVTSGLDSAIVAESEIQRQVKDAYEQTLLHYTLPACMHYLFQKSLKVGKTVRSTLSLAQNQVTIARVLFELGQEIFKDLSNVPLLFIGNSEINRRIIAYFRRKGADQITLCTRSPGSALEMAEKDNLRLLAWEQLARWQDFPLVICGSKAPHYIVREPEGAVKTQMVIDLSVPRNVDPSLSTHPQISLLNMEELGALIETRQRKNSLEIDRAELMILDSVHRYLYAFRQKDRRVIACA